LKPGALGWRLREHIANVPSVGATARWIDAGLETGGLNRFIIQRFYRVELQWQSDLARSVHP